MIVDSQHEESPEFYRKRYEELKARAHSVNTRKPDSAIAENPRNIPARLIVVEETIPGGWYWTVRVPRGQTLRLMNEHATPGVSALIWNADEASERYNPADTVKLQWTARHGRGKLLLSDMGRVLASILSDSSGMHDSLLGGSTPESNRRKYGEGRVRNTRDNFLLAAAKRGLGPRDVGPCITFFAPVATDEAGRFFWREDGLKAGDYVDLRAEMNLLVALSNCPHPLAPGAWKAEPVRAQVWRSPTPAADDFCRRGSEESMRAFENNDAMATR